MRTVALSAPWKPAVEKVLFGKAEQRVMTLQLDETVTHGTNGHNRGKWVLTYS